MTKFNMMASLLSDKSKSENEEKKVFTIRHIDISKIIPDPRNFYSVDDVTELKESILLLGLQQNIVVKDCGNDTYSSISGHRRLKALKELIEEGHEEFKLVPCKVETNIDEIRTELQLIFTNATSRELSDYEKTHQAVRMKELLNSLKKSGVKLTGRLRELVADTLNISTTQVARMEAIDSNLVPEFKEEFKNNNVNISTAYELSGLQKEQQEEAYKDYKDKGTLTIGDVKVIKAENKAKLKDTPVKQQEEVKVVLEVTKPLPEEVKKVNRKYILDHLEKHQCLGCGEEFILSSYVKEKVNHNSCPYCKCDFTEAITLCDNELLQELGCLGIGHYEEEGLEK